MRNGRLMLGACFLLILSGCIMSEQIGEMPQDLTFHFDTEFNRILFFARSAALAAFAFWIFSAWGKSGGSIVVGSAVLIGAGYLAYRDYPTLKEYRVEVMQNGLLLSIPPEAEMEISWGSIETLELEGYEYMSIPDVAPPPMPFASPRRSNLLELPEWESMELTLTNGEKHTLDLKRLSVEQRQILSQTIVKRARLVTED